MKKICVGAILAVCAFSLTMPLRAYVIGFSRSNNGDIVRHRWKSSAFPLTWRMNPVQSARVTGSRPQADVFKAAFAAWQSVTTASVSFTQGADTSASLQPADDNINLVTTNVPAGTLSTGVLALTESSVYLAPGFDP